MYRLPFISTIIILKQLIHNDKILEGDFEMKFAICSYSLSSLVRNGEKTELELISVAAELGFEAFEFSEINPPEGENKLDYAKRLKAEAVDL